jgi:predicted metal-dependent enzyme (double-stranded beta helix superfamily)
MFDPDRFVEECRAAVMADPTHKSVREVVLRAVSDPLSVVKALGEPERAGVEPIYRSPELTILNVVWGPLMTVGPHEHRMWAVIGV